MSNIIKIKKGLNIPLEGKASEQIVTDQDTSKFAIIPDDYPGYTWKVAVKVGDIVKIGSPLMYAKEDSDLCLVSPVAGTVEEIKRGERRKVEYISVNKSEEQTQEIFSFENKKEDIFTTLKRSGLFAMLRQRPFDIVADVTSKPRDIFITAFDTAPLASVMLQEDMKPYLEIGIEFLSQFTEGKVYLSTDANSDLDSRTAEVYRFEGPHPAGNVGTQIAAIKPVNKGETVWTADAMTVARIGKLVSIGNLDMEAYVALTGDDIKEPHIVKTIIGASIKSLLINQIKEVSGNVRIISGNVLTGIKVDEQGFLRYPYRQITVIDEGDEADEFMGWASLDPKKYSVKRSFPAFLRGLSKPFKFDARIKGGHRAMIMSGEYDKVFPMDIYPEYLIKAIMAKDIEKMENLGIYEVAPEDFALPEFVDTSKLELQKIVREGLDYLRKETI